MVMKEGTKQIPLRIDSSLKLALEIEAYKQGRSLNNLLTQIIKEYLNVKK